jgi:hypothetical protein
MSRPNGWIRLSNDIGASDKALELDHYLDGIGLLACILGYCDRQRTNGHIPSRALGRAIAPGCDIKPIIADLVRVGFIDRVDGGYQVHAYLDWQRSSEQITAASAKAKAAADASWDSRRTAGSDATSNAPSIAVSNADREEKTDREEENRSAREDTPPPGDIAKVGSEFEKRTGKTAGSALVSLCADHPTDILLEAIKRAAESGKTSPAYIRAVAEGLTADGWKASAKKPRGEPKWKADAEKAAQSQRTYDKPPVVCAICGDTGATLATGDACECSAGDAWRT